MKCHEVVVFRDWPGSFFSVYGHSSGGELFTHDVISTSVAACYINCSDVLVVLWQNFAGRRGFGVDDESFVRIEGLYADFVVAYF